MEIIGRKKFEVFGIFVDNIPLSVYDENILLVIDAKIGDV